MINIQQLYIHTSNRVYTTSTQHNCFINLPVRHWSLLSLSIKTHGSESRGQEEAVLRNEPAPLTFVTNVVLRRTSELFTGSATVKLANALNKPP